MKRILTRKEKLQLILSAITLPLVVVEIEFDNVKYNQSQYKDLKILLEEELATLDIIVYI